MVRDFLTRGGVEICRSEEILSGPEAARAAIEPLIDALDSRRGAVFASTCEAPGRYALWDRGFVDPPIVVECRDRQVRVSALNERGGVLLPALRRACLEVPGVGLAGADAQAFEVAVAPGREGFAEEERSRQPSVFGVLRRLTELFGSADPDLGLYGAFGYDLAFQFDPQPMRHERSADQRDLVLYLPDEIVTVDHRREHTHRVRFDFCIDGRSTRGLERTGECRPYRPGKLSRGCDHEPGEYAQVVRRARAAFARGDLFEVVPSQVFSEGCDPRPSEVFRRLRSRNPAPYGFLLHLGQREFLVGASPEMFVRVGNPDPRPHDAATRQVETCPIAGTIARGQDPLEDAEQIRKLLTSKKDECELTMCTDVDRNDKSRVCVPGSVRVTARRQIELYSKLIHTVDHVRGELRPEFDALDAFLSHAWAVTVTGAPKARAMGFIEEHELSPRRFYGGAVGRVGFDGRLDTGLTLRTIRIADGVAETRVGATLLFDSDPDAEEAETHLKAAAMLDAIREECPTAPARVVAGRVASKRRVLLVDCRDSFVHTLGSYFRQSGCDVLTLRAGFDAGELDRIAPELLVLSPGPGRPADFGLDSLIDAAVRRGTPIFGVCLGLQAIAEYFCWAAGTSCAPGTALGVLPRPVHGKPSRITTRGGSLFEGLPNEFCAGRYHSLHVLADSLPAPLRVTATDDAGCVMAMEHRSLPIGGVQFHPESILSQKDDTGLRLIENVVTLLRSAPPR